MCHGTKNPENKQWEYRRETARHYLLLRCTLFGMELDRFPILSCHVLWRNFKGLVKKEMTKKETFSMTSSNWNGRRTLGVPGSKSEAWLDFPKKTHNIKWRLFEEEVVWAWPRTHLFCYTSSGLWERVTMLVKEILIRNGRRIYFAVLESILTAIYV